MSRRLPVYSWVELEVWGNVFYCYTLNVQKHVEQSLVQVSQLSLAYASQVPTEFWK